MRMSEAAAPGPQRRRRERVGREIQSGIRRDRRRPTGMRAQAVPDAGADRGRQPFGRRAPALPACRLTLVLASHEATLAGSPGAVHRTMVRGRPRRKVAGAINGARRVVRAGHSGSLFSSVPTPVPSWLTTAAVCRSWWVSTPPMIWVLSAVAVAMSAPWSMMGGGVGSGTQPMSDTTVTGRPGPGSHQVTMSVEVGTSTGCPRVADMSGE